MEGILEKPEIKQKRGRKPKAEANIVSDEKIEKKAIQTQIKAIVEPNRQVSYSLDQDPATAVANATKVVRILHEVIATKKKKVIINGEQYLEFEDWQLLSAPYGVTVKVIETKPGIESLLTMNTPCQKFWAKAAAIRNGQEISSAEAICERSEYNWKSKDDFQLLSMAQTRACAKALRNVFAWVAVLAGYRPTPAEEVSGTSLDLPEGWRKLSSRYPGKCVNCQGEYQRGGDIYFNSNFKGARCEKCPPVVEQEPQPEEKENG